MTESLSRHTRAWPHPTKTRGNFDDVIFLPHQFSVARLMASGFTNREIAERLNLTESAVKGYVYEILRRLGARNRLDAVMIAIRNG